MPRVFEVPVAAARRGFRRRLALLPPASVEPARVDNLAIPGPGGTIPARAYVASGPGPFALVVFFHGGGFVIGDLETHDGMCRRLCVASGCTVLSVDYRLAPEHPFPAAFDDAWAAIQWASRRWERLVLAGDSAGGTLAAAAALRARDEGGPAIRGQVLIYPLLDHSSAGHPSYSEMAEGYGLTRDSAAWFLDQYLRESADRHNPYALPMQAQHHANLPPAFVLTAEYDVLRDEGERYAQRLASFGTPVHHERFAGMNHGFVALGGLVDEADQAIARMGAWIARTARA